MTTKAGKIIRLQVPPPPPSESGPLKPRRAPCRLVGRRGQWSYNLQDRECTPTPSTNPRIINQRSVLQKRLRIIHSFTAAHSIFFFSDSECSRGNLSTCQCITCYICFFPYSSLRILRLSLLSYVSLFSIIFKIWTQLRLPPTQQMMICLHSCFLLIPDAPDPRETVPESALPLRPPPPTVPPPLPGPPPPPLPPAGLRSWTAVDEVRI